MQKEYVFNQLSLIEQLPVKSKTKRKMMPTNVPYYLAMDNQELLSVLPVPAFKYVIGDKRTQEDIVTIATNFRYAVKKSIEDGLGEKFIKFDGIMRVNFKQVINEKMSMITFIKDLQVTFIPDWLSDDIKSDENPLRNHKTGLIVIDQYGDSTETKGGIACVNEPFATCLKNIANIIYDISLTICDQYKHWIKKELKTFNTDKTLSADQLHQAMENLLLRVPEITLRIKNLIQEETVISAP